MVMRVLENAFFWQKYASIFAFILLVFESALIEYLLSAAPEIGPTMQNTLVHRIEAQLHQIVTRTKKWEAKGQKGSN